MLYCLYHKGDPMPRFEKITICTSYWDGMTFYLDQTGEKTFRVGVAVAGTYMDWSKHASKTAAQAEMESFIRECKERYKP